MCGPGLTANLNGREHHTPCHHTEMFQERADVSVSQNIVLIFWR